ncbi:Uncharacterized protein APZ42_029546 [Daphnia magna]|uniref:Uncharacterized protein n=1 Tax=Daphnia magna TaxID=35525 RepID=A0A162D516_9CRUS|nr:Uncharacterized protein APZ42_029546 [Daphnia magna]
MLFKMGLLVASHRIYNLMKDSFSSGRNGFSENADAKIIEVFSLTSDLYTARRFHCIFFYFLFLQDGSKL